jgi:predicted ester cyclase
MQATQSDRVDSHQKLVVSEGRRQQMSEQHKSLARRFYEEVINQKNLGAMDELCTPDIVDHNALPGQRPGCGGLKDSFGQFLTGFPDLRATVHQLVAEGDILVCRFTMEGTHKGDLMGASPTGKRVTFRGIDMVRIVDNRAAEVWHEGNDLEILMQLGVQPPSAT